MSTVVSSLTCLTTKYTEYTYAEELMYITYTVGTQLQHPHDVHSYEHQFQCDCSSEEKTLYQYIPHHPKVSNQFLVQMQHRTQQQSLQKSAIYVQ